MSNSLKTTPEDFDSLTACYTDPDSNLRWDTVFVLPSWLRVWWKSFGTGKELYLRAVRRGEKIIGIAPLQIRNNTASVIGSINVCDYQDFVTTPGMEKEFFNAILDDFRHKGINCLDLEPLRNDSAIMTHLVPLARERRYQVSLSQVDVSLEIELPRGWDEYLQLLSRKQRHELRRKMRNLQAFNETGYQVVEDKNRMPEAVEAFLKLFPEARQDKAEFMTPEMQTFFRSLAESLAEESLLKIGILESGGNPVAMVMYFDYNGNIYLYNSSYNPEYKSLSVGLISKARCIQDSIQKKKRKFDFLKGSEQYKYHLGGKEIPLFHCRISMGDEE